LKSEGIELMLLMIKKKKFCYKSSLKVLDYSLASPLNCIHFVDVLGLKTLFAAFMKKGSKKHKKEVDEPANDEHIVSCIAALFKNLNEDHLQRLVNKFAENEYEKVERLLELHSKYLHMVQMVDQRLQQEMQELESELDNDYVYLQRLDGGLFTLQLIDLILVSASCQNEGIKERVQQLLEQKSRSKTEIISTMEEYYQNIGSGEEDEKVKTEKARLRQLIDSYA